MNSEKRRLLIAGGGTGGHLFPALAVAEAWEAQGGETLFVGTPRGLEAKLLPGMGKRLALLDVGPLKGGGAGQRLRTLLGLPGAVRQAAALLDEFAPHAALGVGGYASAPAMAAAWMKKIPTLLHEQNARPGLTNRWLSRIAREVCISFPEAEAAFAGRRAPVRLTGNPVRSALFQVSEAMRWRGGRKPFQLLIFGGSQGARIFSQTVPRALETLDGSGVFLQVRHQAPEEDLAELRATYEAMGIPAQVERFIQDMAKAYEAADLVICRAGATTAAELTAVGRAALFVPYPHAADDHQTANAQSLVNAGAGWMMRQEEFSPAALSLFLRQRTGNPDELIAAAQKTRTLARPGAATEIVGRLTALALGDDGP
ncbi:MAG: undecaprenyldiphospho-muramoylpentapeptide beta-N-acetylglucosaminyltransferase [Magnetococcales bacterium]|nr:undecaprenyldiphospho-muramoylpentapeptide beta-N-acetylglucosaminyltransferase [Magnetococcales bacterium]